MKAKVDKPTSCTVRISKAAKGKLEIIAERKGVSLGNAVSLIILHYAANNLDYEVSVNDAYKTILNKLTGVDIKFSKIIGPVERTEDFIKSLVREDRRSASGSFSGYGCSRCSRSLFRRSFASLVRTLGASLFRCHQYDGF